MEITKMKSSIALKMIPKMNPPTKVSFYMMAADWPEE